MGGETLRVAHYGDIKRRAPSLEQVVGVIETDRSQSRLFHRIHIRAL